MSILFMDGCERQSVDQWNYYSQDTIRSGNLGGNGSYYHQINGGANQSSLIKTLSASQSQLYISCKVNSPTAASGNNVSIFQFCDSALTRIATVTVNTTTQLFELRRGLHNGTVLATGTKVLRTGINYNMEVYYVPSSTDGTFTLKIDGTVDVTYTGGDTTAGLDDVQTFCLGHYYVPGDYNAQLGTGTGGGGTCYDDIVVSNSGWIGNANIQLMIPNAAGDSTGWTASTGSNYACVDEVAYSDSDYVSVNTADAVDLYNMADPLTTPGSAISSVIAVNLLTRMAYEGSPTPTKQKAAIKIGGSEAYGDDISPAVSFSNYYKIWEQNPVATAAWTEQNLKDLQIGIKSVA